MLVKCITKNEGPGWVISMAIKTHFGRYLGLELLGIAPQVSIIKNFTKFESSFELVSMAFPIFKGVSPFKWYLSKNKLTPSL